MRPAYALSSALSWRDVAIQLPIWGLATDKVFRYKNACLVFMFGIISQIVLKVKRTLVLIVYRNPASANRNSKAVFIVFALAGFFQTGWRTHLCRS